MAERPPCGDARSRPQANLAFTRDHRADLEAYRKRDFLTRSIVCFHGDSNYPEPGKGGGLRYSPTRVGDEDRFEQTHQSLSHMRQKFARDGGRHFINARKFSVS